VSKKTHEREHDAQPHHMHALTKASATHLLRAGHINRSTHRGIVQQAEAGMKAAKRARKEAE
jgi:hypothetical protein